MAHWIIEDRGFSGQYYQCSHCRKMWHDIHDDVSLEDHCPNCGESINDDENEYVDEKTNNQTTDVAEEFMTNAQAAAIIREIVSGFVIPRGCAKSTGILMRIAALCKAIDVLERRIEE